MGSISLLYSQVPRGFPRVLRIRRAPPTTTAAAKLVVIVVLKLWKVLPTTTAPGVRGTCSRGVVEVVVIPSLGSGEWQRM